MVDLRRLGVGAVAVGGGGGGAAEGLSVRRVGAAHHPAPHRAPGPRLPVHQRVEHLPRKEKKGCDVDLRTPAKSLRPYLPSLPFIFPHTSSQLPVV